MNISQGSEVSEKHIYVLYVYLIQNAGGKGQPKPAKASGILPGGKKKEVRCPLIQFRMLTFLLA